MTKRHGHDGVFVSVWFVTRAFFKCTMYVFKYTMIVVAMVPCLGFAEVTSTNYQLNQQGTGFTQFNASSSNYEFEATVGEPGIGISRSANYIFDHGTTWIDGNPTVTITYAVPESRTGAVGTNDDVTFFITVRTANDSDDTILFTSDLATTTADGSYTTQIELTGISAGTYDIGIKGHQHITRVLQDVPIVSGNTALNFSTDDYASTTRGKEVLLAGDVNGTGNTPTTLGDDVVNSVDISTLLTVLDDTDGTGNAVRSNINQDTVVNSVDLSVMLTNLDTEGDN